MEININKIMANVWLAIGIVTLILIPFYGAWHHLLSVFICAVMYLAFKYSDGDEAEKRPDAGEMARGMKHTHE